MTRLSRTLKDQIYAGIHGKSTWRYSYNWKGIATDAQLDNAFQEGQRLKRLGLKCGPDCPFCKTEDFT